MVSSVCSSVIIIVCSSLLATCENTTEDDQKSSFVESESLPGDTSHNTSVVDDFTFLIVPNLTALNLTFVFKPKPSGGGTFQPWFVTTTRRPRPRPTKRPGESSAWLVESTTTSTTTEATPLTTSTTRPDNETESESPIGYTVPCGVRGGSGGFKIVGGTNAQPAEYPWQVSLQLMTGWSARHICGGTVLSPYWVVTAAHCVYGLKATALSIVAGDYNLYTVEGHEQRVSIARIVTHNYRRKDFSNDIALLQLDPPLKVDGKWVAPVCLPDSNKKFTSGYGIVTGWGRLSENGALPHVLQQVALPIINRRHCHALYRKAGYGKYLNKCQMCSGYETGGLDSCQGDSGGPLVCKLKDERYYLCGVVSWGVGCARAMYPGVYTNVPCYSEWIKNVLYNTQEFLRNASLPQDDTMTTTTTQDPTADY